MPRGTHPNSLANLQKGKKFGSDDDSARKAQEKSIAAHAERRTFREGLLLLLNEPIMKDGKPSGKVTQDAIIAALVKRAANGDTRAFEMIRDTIGEKPVQDVKVSTGDFSALDDAFKGMGKK
jgi:hypothetical protein